jgi:SAM-dependent methyltransferase
MVTAVDFAEEGIRYGRKVAEAAGLRIDWRVEDVVAWQPPRKTYDLVFICYLQLPWSEMAQVLRSAWGAVAPGGRLAVVGHDLTNLENGTGGPQDPTVLYVPSQVTASLREIAGDGLRIVREEQRRHEVDHGEAAGTGAEQIDCVVVAEQPR